MEHGRRTSWNGRPRPRIRVRPPQGFAPLFQPGARLTGSSNFGPLSTTPASSWRHILERSSRRISDISNRFWAKNRTYRKQTIKPCLTGARTAIRLFEIRQISAQNDDATRVGPPKSTASRAWGRGHEVAGMSSFLTETAQHSEIDVTHSKQTTGEFLTETRIACRHYLNSTLRRSNFRLAHSARLQEWHHLAWCPKEGRDRPCAGAAKSGIVAQILTTRFLNQISGGKSHGNSRSRTAR
jgi:hypothetical protein